MIQFTVGRDQTRHTEISLPCSTTITLRKIITIMHLLALTLIKVMLSMYLKGSYIVWN